MGGWLAARFGTGEDDWITLIKEDEGRRRKEEEKEEKEKEKEEEENE